MNSLIEQLYFILEEVYVHNSKLQLISNYNNYFLIKSIENKNKVITEYKKSVFENIVSGFISNSMHQQRESIENIYQPLKYRIAIKVENNRVKKILDAKYMEIELIELIKFIDIEQHIDNNRFVLNFKKI